MKIVVHQGSIHVNSVSVVIARDELVVLYADTRAKYPELGPASVCDFSLFKNERTLYAEPTEEITRIVVEDLDGPWESIADAGRYSVRIVLWRTDARSTHAVDDYYDEDPG